MMSDLEPQERSNCDTSNVKMLLLFKMYGIYQHIIEKPAFIRTGEQGEPGFTAFLCMKPRVIGTPIQLNL